MSRGWDARGEWSLLTVKVNDQSESTHRHELALILQGLGIPTRIPDAAAAPPRPGVVVFEIPASTIEEAILALGFHGFSEVRAYGGTPRPRRLTA